MAIQKISNAVLGSGAVTSDSIATGAITVADIPDGEIIDQEPADYYMAHDISYAGLHYAEVGDTFKLSDEVQPSSGSSSVIWTACYMQNG